MPGTVLAVASGKGGVGKTITTVNLATTLSDQGNVVGLIDADLAMPNLAACLGLESSVTLQDVLADRASLETAAVQPKGSDVTVVPGESDLSGFVDADPTVLGDVLDEMATGRDYVFVDTGARLSYEALHPLKCVDEILLVTTPDPAAIRDTRKTLQLAGLQNRPVRGVIVTRVRDDTDAEAIARKIGTKVIGTIPEDPAVTKSTTTGGPLMTHAPNSPATIAYRELAASLD